MNLNFIFLSCLLLASQSQALIVGGEEVTRHDPIQRSTAAIYEPSSNGPGGALCTASVIGKNMAVTAAHCLQGSSYAPVMIFGPNVRSPDSTQRPVIGSVVNPAWAIKQGHGMDQGDIAVVKFGGGLPPGYRPASLDTTDSVKKGDSAILAGYGVSNARTHEGAGVLRKTSVNVASARKGKSEMIFDQSHGHGACHGDSGGPAYFRRGKKMVLGGITNRSYPTTAVDDCSHKVVYTKVASYRPWIEKSEAQLNRSRSSIPQPAADVNSPRLLSHRTTALRQTTRRRSGKHVRSAAKRRSLQTRRTH